MFIRIAEIGLRIVCVFWSLLFTALIIAIFASLYRSNPVDNLIDLMPLIVAFFGILLPISLCLKRGIWRETMMMIASFGWALAVGIWFVSLGAITENNFEDFLEGPFFHLVAMVLFTANGLLSLRSLRRARQSHQSSALGR